MQLEYIKRDTFFAVAPLCDVFLKNVHVFGILYECGKIFHNLEP